MELGAIEMSVSYRLEETRTRLALTSCSPTNHDRFVCRSSSSRIQCIDEVWIIEVNLIGVNTDDWALGLIISQRNGAIVRL